MKKLLAVVFLFIASLSTFAQAEGLKLDNTTVYCGGYSNYVLGNNVIAAKGPVVQCGVTFTATNGLSFDAWGSGRVQNSPNNKFGNEFDATLAWTSIFGPFKVYMHLAHFNLADVHRINSNDVWGEAIDISLANPIKIGRNATLNPFVRIEHADSSGLNVHATQTYLGVKNTILMGNGWTISQTARLGYQTEFPGINSGTNGRYEATASKQVAKGISVGVGYRHDNPFGRDPQLKSTNTFSLTGSYTF